MGAYPPIVVQKFVTTFERCTLARASRRLRKGIVTAPPRDVSRNQAGEAIQKGASSVI
jgi:hypothetical protein